MNKNTNQTEAVLLLAYGAPSSLSDIPAYLTDIRQNRPMTQAFIDEITARYQAIGGKSPLFEITKRIATKLKAAIDKPVYFAMRHWHPFIADVIQQMSRDGIQSCTALCLAPHNSRLSVGAYFNAIQQANAKLNLPITFNFIDTWHLASGFIAALSQRIDQKMTTISRPSPCVFTLFTAHSLPSKILQAGDPYVDELKTTMHAVANNLSLKKDSYALAFQSASQTGEPWLGPSIERVLSQIKNTNFDSVIVVSIGFVTDNIEILYDIDIIAANLAKTQGLEFHRAPMLNDSNDMITIMKAIVV